MLDDIMFVHPKDMQDGKVEIGPRDITTNLPYVPGAHLAFDHHDSETLRVEDSATTTSSTPTPTSAARVVYDYFGGARALPGHLRRDDGRRSTRPTRPHFTREEILDPQGWVLLNFLMDPRTGLGRFREFRISNYQLMMQLIDACRSMTVEEILEHAGRQGARRPLPRARRARARSRSSAARPSHGNLVVLDLRDEEVIHPTNRFMIYALFPAVQHLDPRDVGPASSRTRCSRRASRSSTAARRRTSATLMLEYGGGGHEAAGTCQIENEDPPGCSRNSSESSRPTVKRLVQRREATDKRAGRG